MNARANLGAILAGLTTGFTLTCAHAPAIPPYAPSEVCQPAETGDAANPLLIEDAENGDDQVIVHDGRDGYLYTYVDGRSQLVNGPTVAGVRPVPLAGGAHGSRCAWNLRGRLADERIVFAGLGVNFTDPKSAYDASRFAGVSFFARHGPGAAWQMRVHFPDGNTDPDGGVCGQCFNHFGANIELTEDWKQYTIPFDTLGQMGDWGTPRLERVDPSKLFGIEFRVKHVDEPFDIWIDDIAFIQRPPG